MVLIFPRFIIWIKIQFTTSGYRIVTTPSPGMTTHYAFDGKSATLPEAMLFESLKGIMRTGRGVSATGRRPGRNEYLIGTYQKNKGRY
jgi:hypothetical protein